MQPQAIRHAWLPRTRPPNISYMATTQAITTLDPVELTEPVESLPAGARGGVLELRDADIAMVEITSLPLDVAERIVFVPLSKLRRLG